MPAFIYATACLQYKFTLDTLNQISRITDSRPWGLTRGQNSKPVFVLNAWSKHAARSLNESFAAKSIETCLSSNHKSVVIDARYAADQLPEKKDDVKEILHQHDEEREAIRRVARLNRFMGNLQLYALSRFDPMPDRGGMILRAGFPFDQEKIEPIIAALGDGGIAAHTSRHRTPRQPRSIIIHDVSFPMIIDPNINKALENISNLPGLVRPEHLNSKAALYLG